MSAPRRSLEVPAASPVEPELKPRLSRQGLRNNGMGLEMLAGTCRNHKLTNFDDEIRLDMQLDLDRISTIHCPRLIPIVFAVGRKTGKNMEELFVNCSCANIGRHKEAGRRSEGLPEALGDPSPSIPLGTPNLTGERTQAEDDEPAMSAPRTSLEVPAASPVEPELKPRLSRQGLRNNGMGLETLAGTCRNHKLTNFDDDEIRLEMQLDLDRSSTIHCPRLSPSVCGWTENWQEHGRTICQLQLR